MTDEHDPTTAAATDTAARLFDLSGARAVVTGAASGLGLAIAEVLGANGARLACCDRDEAGLEKAAAHLAARGATVTTRVLDVRDPAAVEAAVASIADELGGIDVAFANAGLAKGASMRQAAGAIDALALEDWREVLAVDLDGAFYTIRSVAAVMKRQRSGSIVATASTAGLRGEPMVSYAYVAAKAALVNLVRQAAIELGPYNVRCNAIAPGPIHTNIGGGGPKPADYETDWTSTLPLGRFGQPGDLKGTALLLASAASSFVTGAIWTLDGGATALNQGRMGDVGPGSREAG